MQKYLSLCFSLFFVAGCSGNLKNDNETPLTEVLNNATVEVITGTINEDFFKKLKKTNKETNTLIVYSFGGETVVGGKIADIIFDAQFDIVIAEACLSACAEYILPSAKNIYLMDEPLIGYHRNPIILEHLLKAHAKKDLEYCNDIGDEKLRKLLIKTGKQPYAWRQTLERLNLLNYSVVYKDTMCPWSSMKFENEFWFPTSEQLKDIFGLTVQGKLCADDVTCYEKKLKHYFKNTGGKFIVGDTPVHIEKAKQ